MSIRRWGGRPQEGYFEEGKLEIRLGRAAKRGGGPNVSKFGVFWRVGDANDARFLEGW